MRDWAINWDVVFESLLIAALVLQEIVALGIVVIRDGLLVVGAGILIDFPVGFAYHDDEVARGDAD